MAIQGDRIYWGLSDEGRLVAADKANGANRVVMATGQAGIADIVTDEAFVYWIDYGTLAAQYFDGRVMKCARTGCDDHPVDVTGPQASPGGLAIDDTWIYWGTGDGVIHRVAK
jgi:hypothetical protein